jgi:hypothetical protein
MVSVSAKKVKKKISCLCTFKGENKERENKSVNINDNIPGKVA